MHPTTSTATRMMAFAALFTLSALIPLSDAPAPAAVGAAAPDAHRQELVALANLAQEPEWVATAGDQQCLALDGLVQTIDEQMRQPWPAARREELWDMRRRAREEQQLLLC